MILTPKKKVGSPVSVKGVRGDYLITLIMYLGGSLFFMLIILILPFPWYLKLILIGITIIYIRYYKYNQLKKLSKGDIYSQTKQYSRKLVLIISKPISKNHGKKN